MSNSTMAQQLEETMVITRWLQERAEDVEAVGDALVSALRTGGRLYVCGNGGSASQAQHFATELVGRFRRDRHPLPAQALSADGSLLTCIANDFDFDDLFARQVHAFGISGDVLVGLSTSGRSGNVLRAFERARELGVTTVGLTGHDDEAMRNLCDHVIALPSANTARIQEGHLMIIHLVCEMIDSAFNPDT